MNTERVVEAMKAAAKAAVQRAIETGTKIVVWKDGKVVELDPTEITEDK